MAGHANWNKFIYFIIALIAVVLIFFAFQYFQDRDETVKTIKIDTPFQVEENGETKDLDYTIDIKENQ